MYLVLLAAWLLLPIQSYISYALIISGMRIDWRTPEEYNENDGKNSSDNRQQRRRRKFDIGKVLPS